MLSRIMWISVAGIALIAGIAIQDGKWIFGWGDRPEMSARDRVIDHSFREIKGIDSHGRVVELPIETKRAMASAVGQLVKAEADLAVASAIDENDEQMQAARARREAARAEVERLKAEIEAFERTANGKNDALREQIRREVREEIRASVRDTVGS